MRYELRRIEPVRAANILALVYGLFTAVFALLLLPLFFLGALLSSRTGGGAREMVVAIFLLILYPALGLVMGWISGFLFSALYNFVIRWTGGLLLRFESPSPRPGQDLPRSAYPPA